MGEKLSILSRITRGRFRGIPTAAPAEPQIVTEITRPTEPYTGGSIPVPIERLKQLSTLMPGRGVYVEEFGRFLAERFTDKSSDPQQPPQGENKIPQGFLDGVRLALFDISRGVDGYTHEPITSSIVGLHNDEYMLMDMCIPYIARAIYPKGFADEIEKIYWGPKVAEIMMS